MKIYEIPQEFERAMDNLRSLYDPDTGEQTATDEDVVIAIKAIQDLRDRSDDAMVWMLQTRANHIATKDAIKNEQERLKARLKSEERHIESLESLIDRLVSPDYQKPMTIGTFTVSYRKSEGVVIDDETKIPEEYMRVKVERTPDKETLKKLLKAGESVAGVRMEERRNLSIN